MEVAVDTDLNLLSITDGGQSKTCDLYSKDAFEKLSHIWLKMSWQQKYSYTFTWLGRPIIQHPEDMVRMQEVICTLAPDVIVETGVAQGRLASVQRFVAEGAGQRPGDRRGHRNKAA